MVSRGEDGWIIMGKPEKFKLAERLCELMDWDDAWSVWNHSLTAGQMRELITRLEEVLRLLIWSI